MGDPQAQTDPTQAVNPGPTVTDPNAASSAPAPSASPAAPADQAPPSAGGVIPQTGPVSGTQANSAQDVAQSLAQDGSQDAAGKPNLFRTILSGFMSHAAGAGRGFETGGILGAVEGAADPKLAQQRFANQRAIANAKASQAQTNAAQAQQNLQSGADTHKAAMASAYLGQL
jgi:hypothetical protein